MAVKICSATRSAGALHFAVGRAPNAKVCSAAGAEGGTGGKTGIMGGLSLAPGVNLACVACRFVLLGFRDQRICIMVAQSARLFSK